MDTDLAAYDAVVPTRDRPEELLACVTALCSATPPQRLVVRDEGDTSAFTVAATRMALDMAAARGIDVVCLRSRDRRGMAYARRCLLEAADAPYVLMVDDDVVVEPAVPDRLLETAAAHDAGYVLAPTVPASNNRRELFFAPEAAFGPGAPFTPRMLLTRHVAPAVAAFRIPIGNTGCILLDRAKALEAGIWADWGEWPGPGEDGVATAILSDRYGGWLRTDCVAWHLQSETSRWYDPQSLLGAAYLRERVEARISKESALAIWGDEPVVPKGPGEPFHP